MLFLEKIKSIDSTICQNVSCFTKLWTMLFFRWAHTWRNLYSTTKHPGLSRNGTRPWGKGTRRCLSVPPPWHQARAHGLLAPAHRLFTSSAAQELSDTLEGLYPTQGSCISQTRKFQIKKLRTGLPHRQPTWYPPASSMQTQTLTLSQLNTDWL